MTDQLSILLEKFTIRAGVFYTGRVCGLFDYGNENSLEGHIHILRAGKLNITPVKQPTIQLNEPSVVFFPRPSPHAMLAQASDCADVVCATVKYSVGVNNPLAQSLPDCIVLPLNDMAAVRTSTHGLMEEAFSEPQPGAQIMLNRLMEVFIVAVLRHLIVTQQVTSGLLSGLSHPTLGKAIAAMHQDPASKWTLQSLAECAFQSRSKFADEFKQIVGVPALEYLTQWRVGLAKSLMLKGKAMSIVAGEVGYESASSFTKTFKKVEGCSPRDWMLANAG